MSTPSRTLEDHPRTTGVKIVTSLDEARWEAFAAEHADASLFHTPAMATTFAGSRGHRPSVWAALDDGGAVRALFTPVSVATLPGPLRTVSTRAVAFAAPIGDPDAVAALMSEYRRRGTRGALFTEVRHHVVDPAVTDVLGSLGFVREPHLNYLIDLRPGEEALWGRVASSARRNVQKARRSGVTVEEASGAADLAGGYEVLRDVYHRIQVPLPDRSLFEAAAAVLAPLGRFSMLLARAEGRTIGVLCLLRYRGVATYWYTGTLREHATLRAGDLLAWHAISSEATAGGHLFDFGGAGRPDEPYGVRDFKAKYGGELVEPGRSVWVAAPVRTKLATVGYRVARRFL